MRLSTARLANTPIRLADLALPATKVHVARTRLIFIHVEQLLHFAKADRDGLVDGYVTAYLPDEVAVLLFRRGVVVNAFAYTEGGRTVLSIQDVLEQMRKEVERSELAFAEAPLEQLAWMYASVATPAEPKFIEPGHPEKLFPALKAEAYTGVLELISNGCVNYLRFEQGIYQTGYFCNKPADMPVPRYLQTLLATRDGQPPMVAAATFPAVTEPPTQAPPELIAGYRELFWAITARADRETGGSSSTAAYRLRDALKNVHGALEAIGQPLDREPVRAIVTPEELTFALSDWALQLLEQVEVVAPGAAPDILKDATKEQRFMLQRAGFYGRLPWTVRW